jgi:esterase/lipase superfamily enzyme
LPPKEEFHVTKPLYLEPGAGEVSINAGPTEAEFDYPVLFGTSRKPLPNGAGFSDERDDLIRYGRVLVAIPKNHQTGSLGSGLGTIFGFDPKLTVRGYEMSSDEAQFLALAMRELPPITGPETGYLVVFIHGYNNSFENVALRAAQFGVDIGVPPNDMFFFSWAAKSRLIDYTFDEATVDTSEIYLRSFSRPFRRPPAAERSTLVAHSMGNRALLRVISMSVAGAASEQGMRFGQIILAAADVDRDLFAQLAPSYLKVSDRTTVYLSPYDFAVAASEHVHDYPRVGCSTAPQVSIPGIDSVVSTIPEDFPAHAYFAEALPVLTDIKNLMLRNQPARSGKEWTRKDGYWVVGGAPVEDRIACRTTDSVAPEPTVAR